MSKNNLTKLQDMLNMPQVGTAIKKCTDLVLRMRMGQTKYVAELLTDLFPDDTPNGVSKEVFIADLLNTVALQIRTKHNTSFNDVPNAPGWGDVQGEMIYKGIQVGELLDCDWNDCWERDCWETRKGFCHMDHEREGKMEKGNRPPIMLSARIQPKGLQTIHAGHHKEVCSCGKVISQCRCMGPKQEYIIERGCASCKQED